MTADKRGVVTLETTALLAGVSVPLFLAFQGLSWHFDTSCREGDAGWFEDLCTIEATLLEKEEGQTGAAGASEIGHPDYDPNPDTPWKGAWVFGAGQSFAKHMPQYPEHADENDVRYVEQQDYRNAQPYEEHYGVTANHFTRGGSGDSYTDHNAWFAETRMIKLDDRIACNDVPSGYCNSGLGIHSNMIIGVDESPSAHSGLNSSNYKRTYDYGTFWIDPNNQHLAVSIESSYPEGWDADGERASSSNSAAKVAVVAGGDLSLTGVHSNKHLIVDARGYDVSFESNGGYLELSNGQFEVNNGTMSQHYENGGRHSGGRYLYAPAEGAVVAAYPYVRYGIKNNYQNNPGQHRVDLRNNPGWDLERCEYREVPFYRPVENDGGYERWRGYDGFSGPRMGASVVLFNGGDTFEMMFVDHPEFTPEQCSTDNLAFFIK